MVAREDGTAYGYPLINNRDIALIRKTHRVHLAKYGNLSIKAKPLTAYLVAELADKFSYTKDVAYIPLHAIILAELNLGLRYDEITKLHAELLSVTSGGIDVTLRQIIKTSSLQRDYSFQGWPGNSILHLFLYFVHFVALPSWLAIRGTADGPLFLRHFRFEWCYFCRYYESSFIDEIYGSSS